MRWNEIRQNWNIEGNKIDNLFNSYDCDKWNDKSYGIKLVLITKSLFI